MRLMPCENCRSQGAMLSDGKPYACGTAPLFPTLTHCARCKRKTRVTASMWNRQPELSAMDMHRLGILDDVAKDFTLGAALPIEHARDLVHAGLSLQGVHDLTR